MVRRRNLLLLLILAGTALLSPPVYAFPAGGGSISFFTRHSEQDSTALPTLTTDDSLLRLDLYQTVPGYGRVFTSVDQTWTDSSDSGSTSSLSRYQVGIEGFRAGSRLYSLTAGDTSFRFTNQVESFPGPFTSLLFLRPPIMPPFQPEQSRFTNATYSDVTLRGALMESSSSRDRLILLGGRLTIPAGFQGNTFTVLDETMYGGLWGRQWNDRLHLGVGLLRTSRQQLENSTETLDNTIVLLDGSYRISPAVKLMAEFKENIFSRESGGDSSGLSLKAGTLVSLPRTTLEFNYRRTDPDFVFVRETLQTERDTEGIYASAEFRPRVDTTLYATSDWTSSNIASRADIPDVDSLSLLLGGYVFNPAYPTLSLRFSLTDRSSRGGTVADSDTTTYLAHAEVSRAFSLLTPYIRLTAQRQNESGGSGQPSSDSGSVLVGARSYGRGVSLYLEGEQQLRKVDGSGKIDSSRIRGGLSTTLFSRLGLYLDGEYGSNRDNGSRSTSDTFSTGGGATLNLPGGYLVAGDLRYAQTDLSAQTTTSSSTLQASLTLTKRFGWGVQPVHRGGQFLTTGLTTDTGEIEGFIYQDLNRNNLRDADEPGISGIAVLLEDGSSTRSDPLGRYRFPTAAAGIHQVRINERELPASFNLLTKPLHRVEVGLREKIAVNFPLIVSGSLRGRVVSDVNGNASADEGDTGVADVLVYLRGTQVNGFTDSEGVFSFENLLPGSYETVMDTANLPEGMTLLSADSQLLEVVSGKETAGVVFLLAPQKREVVRKVFGQKTAQAEPVAVATLVSAAATAEKVARPPQKGTGSKKKATAGKGKTRAIKPPVPLPEPVAAPENQAPAEVHTPATVSTPAAVPAPPEIVPPAAVPGATEPSPVGAPPAEAPSPPAVALSAEPAAAAVPSPLAEPHRTTDEELVVFTIHFETDSTRLSSPEDLAIIHTAARLLVATPSLAAAIEGHCDLRGSEAHNLKLGDKRGKMVVEELARLGVHGARIQGTGSFGEARPLCTEPREECHRQNRRSHIRIVLRGP